MSSTNIISKCAKYITSLEPLTKCVNLTYLYSPNVKKTLTDSNNDLNIDLNDDSNVDAVVPTEVNLTEFKKLND